MRTNSTMTAKSLTLAVATLAFLTLSQAVAQGDEITVSGTTAGTVTGVPQLTFAGNAFTGTTALGIGALSGDNSYSPRGSFTFTLNDVFIQSGQTAPLLAGLTGLQTANVAEPAALLLLGTSLAGVASKLRKRRRTAIQRSK